MRIVCVTCFSLILGSFCTLSSVFGQESAAASGNVGFSKTKPTEGPTVEVEGGFLIPYKLTVPGSEVQIDMVPVPGGTYLMGSKAGAQHSRT